MKTKKFISLLMAILFLFQGISLTTWADNNLDTPIDEIETEEYQNISDLTAYITASGLILTVYANMNASSSYSMQIKSVLYRRDGNDYIPINTWTASGTGRSLTLSKKVAYNPLKKYRLITKFTCGSETVTKTYDMV